MKKNLCVILLSCMALVAAAQDRYLVSSKGEVIFLNRGESAIDIVKKEAMTSPTITADSCAARVITGRSQIGNVNFGYGKGDVCLMRLVAPVAGVCDK